MVSCTLCTRSNIRCNGIAPGFLRTHQNENFLFNEDKTPTARTEKYYQALLWEDLLHQGVKRSFRILSR